MDLIGKRLSEERKRQVMNQDQFAAIGGVTRPTQSRYERGDRSLDAAYLSKLAAHGVDVQYIITGARTASATAVRTMSESWEAIEHACAARGLTLSPTQKRKAAEALYHARQTQLTDKPEALIDMVLGLVA